MKSPSNYKEVKIDILTYPKETNTKMNDKKNFRNQFICAICLNNNQRTERPLKSCPVCATKNDLRQAVNNMSDLDGKELEEKKKNTKNKTTQTVEALNTGLTLLNEVLTVFRNKKSMDFKKKTDAPSKDVSLQTDRVRKRNLCTSKLFISSIEENKLSEDGKFTILNQYQPGKEFLIDLSKQKSASIPQMKLDELKYSLKQKTKSKDAIKEVNRMFATVKRNESQHLIANRPLIRNGPRVLPVVKTDMTGSKCCQFINDMSSGDSGKHERYEYKKGACDKCVYMLCCHCKNSTREMQTVTCCSNVKQCKWQCVCK